MFKRLWFRFINQFYARSYSGPKAHVCWWGATLGPWYGQYVVIVWHPYDGGLRAYTSPNATPWHHDAKSLPLRRQLGAGCVCSVCSALRELTDDGYRAVPGQ